MNMIVSWALAVGLLLIGPSIPASAAADELTAARTAFERKEYDAAVRLLDKLIAASPEQPAAYELRTVAQGFRGRPEEALADFDHLARAGKEPADLLRRLCVGLLVNLLGHDQELVRGAAATALGEAGSSSDAQAALTTPLRDPNRKSTRLNSSHIQKSRMPSSA